MTTKNKETFERLANHYSGNIDELKKLYSQVMHTPEGVLTEEEKETILSLILEHLDWQIEQYD